jgi:MFS family permease
MASAVIPCAGGRGTTDHRRALMQISLGLGGTLVYCQQSVVLPLAPRLPAILHVDPAAASWVLTATLLTGATATPVFARLGDVFGKRRMLLVAIATMLVGAIVCALSGSLAWLVAGRVIAGGGLGVMPLSMSILRDELPPERLNSSIAAFGGTAAIGIATGPVLGGLVSGLSVAFGVIAGLSAVSLLLTVLFVPSGRSRPRVPVDVPGALGLTALIVLTLLPLTMGRQWGWLSPSVWGLLLGALVLGGLWVLLELRRVEPFIDLRLNSRRSIALTHAASCVSGLMMFGNALLSSTILLAPRSTGYGMGLDSLQTGLTFLVGAATMIVAAPVTSRLLTARGARFTVILGAVVVGTGYLLRLGVHDHLSGLLLTFGGVYAGVGLLVAGLAVLTLDQAPDDRTAEVLGAQQVARLGGQAASSGIVGAVTGWFAIDVAGTTYASWTAVVVCSLIAVCASVVCIALFFAIGRGATTDSSRSGRVGNRRSRRVSEALIEGNA